MANPKHSWDWITNEMFEEKVREIASDMGTDQILDIGDIYSIFQEHVNNQALEELALENHMCTTCGTELDEESNCPKCNK